MPTTLEQRMPVEVAQQEKLRRERLAQLRSQIGERELAAGLKVKDLPLLLKLMDNKPLTEAERERLEQISSE